MEPKASNEAMQLRRINPVVGDSDRWELWTKDSIDALDWVQSGVAEDESSARDWLAFK